MSIKGLRPLVATLLLLPFAACGGDDAATVPDGVTFQVEQARQDLQGRNIQLRVVNEGSSPVTVTRAELVSKRFDGQATYRGPATIQENSKTNLTVEMPMAACGKGIGMTATVHYRVGEGEERTSVVRPKDHYGSVALAMARDCAQSAIGALAIDKKFSVAGKGSDSVLEIGMTFTPRPDGDLVRIGPLDGTTLLKPAPGSGIEASLAPGAEPVRVVVEIIPNRCDVHVVAEDRTGATMPLHVDSEESGASFFYLKFTEGQRGQIFEFIAAHCGFGTVQDPLLAP